MELKSYQQDVLNDLRTYFDYLTTMQDPAKAFDTYWEERLGPYNPITRKGMRPYLKTIPKAVHLCVKVPTAGGKTFIACNALKVIFDRMPKEDPKVVVWLVPWSNLLDQTVNSLSDPNHPYRQKINTLFNHRVDVYDKNKLLQGASFNPGVVREQLSIIVMSFASLRARNKDDRKVYQENGQLASFVDQLTDKEHVLENTDESALINIIRSFNPVVVVDESHNAESDLSVEMLKALNPSYILDLTATPKENSNIVSMVSAMKLKKEHMVKLPIIAYNHREKTEVIDSALHLRQSLEQMAIAEQKAGGKYIRPIVLFQAQPKTGEENTTFEKLKALLIKAKIPEEQIKIKTATINELKGVDLLSPDCQVRYIITVNALKEGWDCPFAYILASLADRSSAVDVEQIVGRVLRQPYVTAHKQTLLNMSYVLTASLKFENTLQNIIQGLQAAGFSEKDYRAENKVTPEDIAQAKEKEIQKELFAESTETTADDIDPEKITFDPEEISEQPAPGVSTTIEEIIGLAHEESEKTEEQMKNLRANPTDPIFTEMADKVVFYPMRADVEAHAKAVILPKFYLKIPSGGLLEGMNENIEVNKNALLEGFRLVKKDTEINFEALATEVYKIDIESGATTESYRPTASKIKKGDARNLLMEHILSRPKSNQVKDIAHMLRKHLGDLSPVSEQDVTKYLTKVLEDMSTEEFTEILNRELLFGRILKQKIQGFMDEYAEKQFGDYLETGKIFMKPVWKFPEQIVPGMVGPSIVRSLYEKEGSVNNFEHKIILEVASMDNVAFWHRNLGRGKGFAINGFKSNHYPDFIILTQSGNLIVLETKGDDRDNSDSQAKVRLGNTWAIRAGQKFKYYMVFEKNSIDGAYTWDRFKELMEGL
ncbi:DEAD/DEAH box helicase [Arundinibacter roseus]|uniref:Restriction endonuclease n=1 Tax=Arundinibacter roseus TaxID=2070510 RepID=A0A4R4KA07_9BACT|nr:DEAD/DEAH box helicase family protein [Arundinibacter roseus]TDB64363.1 restriction endonuclease [Arundinibacter roseus]